MKINKNFHFFLYPLCMKCLCSHKHTEDLLQYKEQMYVLGQESPIQLHRHIHTVNPLLTPPPPTGPIYFKHIWWGGGVIS